MKSFQKMFIALNVCAMSLSACNSDGDDGSTLVDNPTFLQQNPSINLPQSPTISSTTLANRYQFANQCYRVQANNAYWVNRDKKYDYSSDVKLASRFYFKPAQLGKYLLLDEKNQFLQLNNAKQVVSSTSNTPANIWELIQIANTNTFALKQNNQWLKTDQDWHMVDQESQATALIIEPAENCAQFPESTLDAQGSVTKTNWEDGSVYGIADTHVHLFMNEAAGGRVVHGEVFNPLGVTQALNDAEVTFGKKAWADVAPIAFAGANNTKAGEDSTQKILMELSGAAIQKPTMQDTRGWPYFTEWPNVGKYGSQLFYYRWVERAYLSGIRLMGLHLQTNNVICKLTAAGLPIGDPTWKNKYRCEEQASLDLQTQRAYELEEYIDAQAGGPGKGWFRIVKTPKEAREAIAQGKMAALLGYEANYQFDCYEFNKNCTPEYIRAGVRQAYGKGIRTMYITHRFDNKASGAKADKGMGLNILNVVESGHAFDLETCTVPYDTAQPINAASQGLPQDIGNIAKPVATVFGLLTGKNIAQMIPSYPNIPAACNKRGLSETGKAMIDEMMKLGMIIQADHLSEKAYNEFLTIAKTYQYPWSHDHYGGNSLASEAMIVNTLKYGGYVAGIPGNASSTMDYVAKHTKINQRYGFYPGIGYSTDGNGGVTLPTSRHGKVMPSHTGPVTKISYPFKSFGGDITFTQPQIGNRTLDFDQEGVVHYGLFPELIEDMRLMGYSTEEIKPLFQSAEAYIRTWEQSILRSKSVSR